MASKSRKSIDWTLSVAAIREIIEDGRQCADQKLLEKKIIDDRGAVLSPRALGQAYHDYYDLAFRHAVQHDPHGITSDCQRMNSEMRRQKLYLSVKAAAALCTIGNKIQKLDAQEKKIAETAIRTSDGITASNYLKQNDHKACYRQYYVFAGLRHIPVPPRDTCVHPKVVKWLDAVMRDTMTPGEIEKQRPALVAELETIFKRTLAPKIPGRNSIAEAPANAGHSPLSGFAA